MKSYLLTNDKLKRAAVAFMILALLLLPLQAQAIGHDSRLVVPGSESEGSVFTVGRMESPDMLMARTAAESSAVSSFARVESPDMLMARAAAEGTGAITTPAVDTAVSGVNLWMLITLLALIISLASVLVFWERLFPVTEKDVERASDRCKLVGVGC